MARLPRLTVPGYAHHIIQRGNNRQTIFVTDEDYRFMLSLLEDAARENRVAVHAYVLMGNHFHLLATPATEEGLPRMMQAIGRRYVRYFNRVYDRTGTLWEGRYRSTVIEAERYLLSCMAYIDLNPVRAAMVAQPGHYLWSSHSHYTGLRGDKVLTPHPMYWALGNTPFAREAAYVALVQSGLSGDEVQALTEATLHGWALGSEAFKATLQKKTTRRVAMGRAGRPPSKS